MRQYFDKLWHYTLKRPYRLVTTVDQGEGVTVLFLHGIGASSKVWQPVIRRLAGEPCRLFVCDLLGFGESSKPTWAEYSTEDHARAVIHTLAQKRVKRPIIIVGHSMGCLIAVHIARLRPDLVKQLILYEMPLYAGLPEKRRYKVRRDLYFALYNRIVKHPEFSPTNSRVIQKLAAHVVGFTISRETWIPFVRSLKNTIMQQTTLEDLKRVQVPTEAIYGSLDMVVIRGNPRQVFGEAEHIHTQVITGRHSISVRASMTIASQVTSLLHTSKTSAHA
jgi:pimeloyl-ACP methyl ester carboxylesterase